MLPCQIVAMPNCYQLVINMARTGVEVNCKTKSNFIVQFRSIVFGSRAKSNFQSFGMWPTTLRAEALRSRRASARRVMAYDRTFGNWRIIFHEVGRVLIKTKTPLKIRHRSFMPVRPLLNYIRLNRSHFCSLLPLGSILLTFFEVVKLPQIRMYVGDLIRV